MVETARRWEAFIVFTAVAISVPLLAFLATGIYNLATTDRPGLEQGVLLSFIALVVLWMAVMGALWILENSRQIVNPGTSGELDQKLAELQEENRRLREIVSNLSEALDNLSLHEVDHHRES